MRAVVPTSAAGSQKDDSAEIAGEYDAGFLALQKRHVSGEFKPQLLRLASTVKIEAELDRLPWLNSIIRILFNHIQRVFLTAC